MGRWAALGVSGVLLSLSAACSADEVPARETKAASGATAGASPRSSLPEVTPLAGFPAKVKNFDGRTALLASKPARILAGDASLLEGLIEFVDPARMVALPSTALSYSRLSEDAGAWTEVPLLKSLEAEEILERQPDLLVAHAYQAGSTLDRVVEHDVPVVFFPIATTWKELLASLTCLARLVGEEERGAELIAALEERRKALQVKAPRSGLRILPYGNYGSGGTTAGAGTTWQVMIELAGMRNAAAEAGLEGHPDIDFEQLLAIDPDFFLLADRSGQEGGSAEALLLGEPLLANLRAVRERRFLRLPEHLYSSASHHLLSAAERIAAQADAALAE
jgi:iron complex transport system substrate-binding protein